MRSFCFRIILLSILFSIILSTVFGCGGAGGSESVKGPVPWPTDTGITEPLTATTGSQAISLGSLETNHVQVSVPAGTFAPGITVTVAALTNPPPVNGEDAVPLGAPVEITVGDLKGRIGGLMTVTMKLDASAGTDPGLIWATYYDGQQWQYFSPDSVDINAGTMTFSTGHLTLFGKAKLDVTKFVEKYAHSKTLASMEQKKIVDKVLDKLAETAIDQVLNGMGLPEDSGKRKVLESLLKDDEYGDLYDQFKEGDVETFTQTLTQFVGKKCAENLDPAWVSRAMAKKTEQALSGTAIGLTTDVSQAAGLVYEGDYAGAGRLLAGSFIDSFAIIKAGKVATEIINYQIGVWKQSEIEAAYQAYKNGKSVGSAGLGYEVDKGDFEGLWGQMTGIDERLKVEAVAKEKRIRELYDQPALTPGEEDAIRTKVKTDLERMFKERAAQDAIIEKNEADLKILADAFDAAGLLDSASGYRYADDTIEVKMNTLMHVRDMILRDTKGKTLTTKDIVALSQTFLAGDFGTGRKNYLEMLQKKFGIGLAAQPATPAPPMEGLIKLRDKTQFFGTEANPFKVTISGKVTGDPELRFEGVKYLQYAELGGEVMGGSPGFNLVFVFSIPASAKKTSLDFENVVVKVGEPGQKVVQRSIPRADDLTPSQDIIATWSRWAEGMFTGGPIKSSPKDSLGGSWNNGTPVSGKDMVLLDTTEKPLRNAAGGAVFLVKYTFEMATVYGPPSELEKQYAEKRGVPEQMPPYSSTNTYGDQVIIKLIRR